MKALRFTSRLAIALTLGSVSLAACATTSPPEPKIETRIVTVPVIAACVPKSTPAAPQAYADDTLPQGPEAAADRYRLRAQANEQRKARLALVEPIVAACR